MRGLAPTAPWGPIANRSRLTSEAVHAYLGHLPDEAIDAMLYELSIELASRLAMSEFMSHSLTQTWILDAGGRRSAAVCGPDKLKRGAAFIPTPLI